jgi:hypothetical protein
LKTAKTLELEAIFRQQGFTAVKAEIWANFVRHVFQIYWDATDQLLTVPKWEEFKNKRGALGGPKKRRGKVNYIPVEDAITSEIGALVNLLRLELPVDHFLRLHEVNFEYEALVYSKTRAGRHSKKVDFRVCAQSGTGAPMIAIEAKPLTNTSDITNRYLNEEGIGCFFNSDSPYTDGPIGAMFAYTINDAGHSMRDDVYCAMNAFAPVPTAINKVSFSGDEWATCTTHFRSHGMQPIAILHVERLFPPVPETS